jgi:hypothetical protein
MDARFGESIIGVCKLNPRSSLRVRMNRLVVTFVVRDSALLQDALEVLLHELKIFQFVDSIMGIREYYNVALGVP